MKYLMASILFFVVTNCFAIDQNLIDGANKYEIAVADLKKIESQLSSAKKKPEYWAKQMDGDIFIDDYMMQFYVDKINESNLYIKELESTYVAAKGKLEQLKPIKKK